MAIKTCTSTTKICAMCIHWNSIRGGNSVRPKVNARNFFEYDSEETQICTLKHIETKAWHSCSDWQRKY